MAVLGRILNSTGRIIRSNGQQVGDCSSVGCPCDIYQQSRVCCPSANNFDDSCSLSGLWLKVSDIPASFGIKQGTTCYYFLNTGSAPNPEQSTTHGTLHSGYSVLTTTSPLHPCSSFDCVCPDCGCPAAFAFGSFDGSPATCCCPTSTLITFGDDFVIDNNCWPGPLGGSGSSGGGGSGGSSSSGGGDNCHGGDNGSNKVTGSLAGLSIELAGCEADGYYTIDALTGQTWRNGLCCSGPSEFTDGGTLFIFYEVNCSQIIMDIWFTDGITSYNIFAFNGMTTDPCTAKTLIRNTAGTGRQVGTGSVLITPCT